jgi:T5SS/PEP-CTERM-associated repeat protein
MVIKNYLGTLCACCLTAASLSSHAVPTYWADDTGGTFNDPTNWTGGILPGVGDEAVFELGSTYSINFSATPSNNQKLLIRNDDVSFDLGGYSYTLTSGAFPQASLIVGELNGDIGQLTVTNGTVSTYHTLVGDQAGSNGTLNISTGGVLGAAGVLRLGWSGTGTLNINDGGTVTNNSNSILGNSNGATGNAIVDGAGSSWTTGVQYIGYSGEGNLTVQNDALVTINGPQYLGYQNGASGDMSIQSGGSVAVNSSVFFGYAQNSTSIVTIDGTGSSLSAAGEMHVGDSGTGTLTVSNGANIANNTRAIISIGSTATGTVNIDGGSWANNGEHNIGWTGDGTMNISNGGTVSGTYGSIARYAGSTGVVNVDGTGSIWTNTLDLSMGGSVLGGSGGNNNGSLNITNGGVVSNRNGVIGHYSGSSGSVTVDGAGTQWNNAGAVHVGNSGQGSLLVSTGGSVTSTRGYVGLANTPVSSSATITGADSIWTTSDFLEVRYGSLNINNGGSVTTQNYGNISSSLGEVNVDGGSSTWDITNYLANGGGGQMNITNDGSVSIGSYLVNNGTNGQLNITDGGSVSTGTYAQLSGANSTTTIDGAGSLLDASTYIDTINNGSILNITNGGAASATDNWIRNGGVVSVGGTGATLSSSDSIYVGGYDLAAYGLGTLNINPGGIANAGDTLKIWSSGTVNLNGGTINTNTLDIAGGAFNHIAGALNFTTDFILGAAGPLGSSYSLNSLQSLGVVGIATIDPASVLTLDGGTFSAGTLANNGTFQFNSGTFNLTNSNMTIGAGGLFGSNAQFGPSQTVNVSNATTVNSGSVLTLNNGSFSSGAMTNNGDIVLNGASSRLGGTLVNHSLLKGTGRVNAQVTNNNGAQIRVASGESMRFTSAGNTNAGRIEVIGGEVEFDQNLVNQSGTGNIVARDAALRFNGGLDNEGGMGLSFGTTDVFGNIDNTGSVIISGNSNATFYDDYINNGITTTSIGSNAVFFGSVSGGGSYTGGGTLFFEGDLAPGNSPALVTVDGDMNLGYSLTTTMELAGTTRGSEYDAFDIAGDLSLGGTLDIDFLSIFTPTGGDYFDLFLAESISGDFISLLFPELSEGQLWNLTLHEDFYGSADVLRLSVSSVPVPPAVWLFGSGLLGLIGLARRKA